MSLQNHRAPSHDERWGDHVPWSLRYEVVLERGEWAKFFSLVCNRLSSIFEHHEAGIPDYAHFMERLFAESLGRFVVDEPTTPAYRIRLFFSPAQINREMKENRSNDPFRPMLDRLEVLQSFLVLLPLHQRHNILPSVIRDIRRFAAEAGILLSVKGDPPTLLPLEEPLLQKEVLDRLLPRLEAKFPDRATDLIKAYHDVLKGVDTNTVFANAFKALEQLARDLSGNPKLELTKEPELRDHFSKLHRTILVTITKLAAQRGDEGGHGRLGPDEYEIRYLLFSICNVALLLLDYKEHCG